MDGLPGSEQRRLDVPVECMVANEWCVSAFHGNKANNTGWSITCDIKPFTPVLRTRDRWQYTGRDVKATVYSWPDCSKAIVGSCVLMDAHRMLRSQWRRATKYTCSPRLMTRALWWLYYNLSVCGSRGAAGRHPFIEPDLMR